MKNEALILKILNFITAPYWWYFTWQLKRHPPLSHPVDLNDKDNEKE